MGEEAPVRITLSGKIHIDHLERIDVDVKGMVDRGGSVDHLPGLDRVENHGIFFFKERFAVVELPFFIFRRADVERRWVLL